MLLLDMFTSLFPVFQSLPFFLVNFCYTDKYFRVFTYYVVYVLVIWLYCGETQRNGGNFIIVSSSECFICVLP